MHNEETPTLYYSPNIITIIKYVEWEWLSLQHVWERTGYNFFWKAENTTRHADHVAPSIHKKLALSSPTSGGHLVGIVRSRTQAKEF
jgi:hypothetical protein